MMSMLRRIRSKVPNIALGVIVGLMVGGGAFAVAQTTKSDDGGVHGGPKPRFHDASECNLVDVSKLPGNWTHGDYVSAVEKADPSKVREAAHSRCGKPSHAGKGRGPKDKGTKQKDATEKERAKPSKTPKASPKPTATGSPSSSPTPEASPTSTTGATASPSATAS